MPESPYRPPSADLLPYQVCEADLSPCLRAPSPAGQTASERVAAILDAFEIPQPLADAWREIKEG